MKLHYAHLHLWKATPFVWGVSDCMLAIADYLKSATGIDCAAHLRGAYNDMASCARLTGYHLDPVAAAEDCVRRIPLQRIESPQEGDVGVVIPDHSGRGVGAIFLGRTGNWAVRGEAGLVIGRPVKVLAAWSVGERFMHLTPTPDPSPQGGGE
jgi:hypothetical protein